MKAMIGTNSKQLSGCLVLTRLHSQQNHFPDHAKLPRPAYISTIFIVFKERLMSFKRKKKKIAADHVVSSRQRGWLRSHRRPLLPLSARAPGWKMGGLGKEQKSRSFELAVLWVGTASVPLELSLFFRHMYLYRYISNSLIQPHFYY